MFDHILIPLDGSELAEAAIPPAQLLCKALGSQITLLHVIEKDAPEEIHSQQHLTNEADAIKYLKFVAREHFGTCAEVRTHVHTDEISNVPRSIVEHSEEFKPDLIIMSAHGEGGIHDFMVGSIPQQVVSFGTVPVLLLQPREGHEYDSIKFERFLVALDGEKEHEHSYNVAISLAQRIGAALHLIRIVPTLSTLNAEEAMTGTLLPTSTTAILDIAEEEACDYVRSMMKKAKSEGVVTTAEVDRGNPATKVVEISVEQKSDLIILSTHGKKGINAFWAGSVAPTILARTQLPVLLVPVES